MKKAIIIIVIVILSILMIIAGLFLINQNTIKYTEFMGDIFEIARNKIDDTKLEIETRDMDQSERIEAMIIYIASDDTLSSKDYDEMLKNEITKVYDEIKNKKIANDTPVEDKEKLTPLAISFTICLKDGGIYSKWLGSAIMEYSFEDGWNASYNKIMSQELVTKETLEKALVKESYFTRR